MTPDEMAVATSKTGRLLFSKGVDQKGREVWRHAESLPVISKPKFVRVSK